MSADVLERNVRLLLRKSYVPALPAPPFRDRLESLFLAEAARRARSARPVLRPTPRLARPLRVAAALAAAMLALFLGWRLFAGGGTLGERARLVARGDVALGLPGGEWRAADDAERAQGHRLATQELVVATPSGAGLDVLVAAGRVRVDERSELELERRGESVLATLRSGAARFVYEGGVSEGETVELVTGVERELVAAATAPSVAQRPAASGREELAAGSAEEAQPAEPAAAPPTGLVVSAQDGSPLREFRVALLAERHTHETPPPLVRDFASADGTFRWPDAPAGKQRVFVHAPGFALCALGEHDLSAGGPLLRAELVRGVALRGSVLDEDGNPVPNALVASEDEAPADGLFLSLESSAQAYWLPIVARTGADGRFELANLNPGRHTLRASAPGHAPAWIDGASAPGADVEFELSRGGAVEGRATGDDGGPWAGAEVVVVAMNEGGRSRMAYDYSHTDADGRYRFEHLPPVTMIVVMVRAEGRPEVRPVQIVEGETVRADFDPPRRGARLFGRILRGGEPAPRVSVGLFDIRTASWNQDWVATTTLEDGRYSFEGVLPGRYALYLIDEMGQGLRCVDELDVDAGALEVERDVHVPSGRMLVTAFDARSAEPVDQAALIAMRVEERGGQTFAGFGMSGADGRLEFYEMRPGTYQVWVYPTRGDLGFGASERVTLGDEPVEIEIALEEGTAVEVVVRDADGRPLEGAAVVFHDEAGDEHLFSRVPLTDAAGRYRARGVRPGRYRVEAQLAGHAGAPVELRAELGSVLEVPLVLTPSPSPTPNPSAPGSGANTEEPR